MSKFCSIEMWKYLVPHSILFLSLQIPSFSLLVRCLLLVLALPFVVSGSAGLIISNGWRSEEWVTRGWGEVCLNEMRFVLVSIWFEWNGIEWNWMEWNVVGPITKQSKTKNKTKQKQKNKNKKTKQLTGNATPPPHIPYNSIPFDLFLKLTQHGQ